MLVAHWLIVLFALLGFVWRKRLLALLQWHPVILLGNAVMVGLIIGFYFLVREVFDLYAWWGMGGMMVGGVILHAWHRLKYGYWLGD